MKQYISYIIDVVIISFACSSMLLIVAKLYNLNFVKHIDSTTLVAIPASILAYFTYKVSKKQTHQIIIKQYTEHMEDFFDTWIRYQNSFPLPKYLGIMKDINESFNIILNEFNTYDVEDKLKIISNHIFSF